MTLSLCMIVKDEEKVLARCLKSITPYIDELIVVDTGSTDRTKEIASQFHASIYDFSGIDDFSAARNFSFSKASCDYIMWLDADDVLPTEQQNNLLLLKQKISNARPDVILCPYELGYPPSTVFYRERILRRKSCFLWQGAVHECISPKGKLLHSNVAIRHVDSDKERSDRNLNIYLRLIDEGKKLSPRDEFYFARELYYHQRYRDALSHLLPLQMDKTAWYVNQIEGCRIAAQCFLALGEWEEAKNALFDSFRYGEPRAGILCDLGALLRKQGKNREAIFWLNCALHCQDHTAEGDFENPDDRRLHPLLELTCAYYALGETGKAVVTHKLSKELAPDHFAVLHNESFYRSQSIL